jgi:segregation and condensation protein B
MPTPKQILEAVLFASDAPLELDALAEVIGDRGVPDVRALLEELRQDLETGERGVALQEIAGGFQILSHKECAPWVERMLRSRRKARLSKAGLEALAIVAYRQPITKVDIDSIRGVDSSGVLHTLLERNLITIEGRSQSVGRPLLYATTPDFLSYMGINDLADLPELKEMGSVLEERERLRDEPPGAEGGAEPGAPASQEAPAEASAEAAEEAPVEEVPAEPATAEGAA